MKAIETQIEYTKALSRTVEIFYAEEGTTESEELEQLLVLINDYEDKHIVLPEA